MALVAPAMTVDAGLEPGAFRLGVSRGLTAWIVVAAVTAGGLALWYLPVLVASGVLVLIAWRGWWDLRLHALRQHPSSLVALRCEATGLAYRLRQGDWLNGKPQTGGLVHPWLTVVRLRDDTSPRKTRTLVLLRDAVSAEQFRRLRVHLGWRHPQHKPGRADKAL